MHLNVSSAKWRQFCLVFKVLSKTALYIMMGDIFSCYCYAYVGYVKHNFLVKPVMILDTLARPLRICCLSLGNIWYHPLSSIIIRPYILRSILNCHSLSTKRVSFQMIYQHLPYESDRVVTIFGIFRPTTKNSIFHISGFLWRNSTYDCLFCTQGYRYGEHFIVIN